MKPCPCGYSGHPEVACKCTEIQVSRYRQKISGPLLDRFDLHVEVPAVAINELQRAARSESSAQIASRVNAARQAQLARSGCANQYLQGEPLEQHCQLGEKERQLLERALQRLGLSARAYHRVLRVARTIADLSGSPHIQAAHLLESLSFRALDRRREPLNEMLQAK
ncbi:predicted ATPase with chaperone activity [Hahella chejuensis KCTC 2396]|uniref:Predicted ATPase with chaperone activity n=1 Tax=Hahella chejuensis (strain KCTC 2396) TaxID=349521 RepID=Q2S8L1_HAHCH|nr:ATP-binding protein [Hahella chejuensis]ABC33013.1 predicted ATPase with chaperone activity [Hahella chejuensis KCTC 2396]